jgi:homocitrate synthase
VDGLDVVIGTSSFLREHSHGKDMAYIEKTAIEVIEYIKSKGLEVRCESIRSLCLPLPHNITPQ